jgi:ankyrin repeat protein
LKRGADANANYVHTSFPDHPKLSCLYGATGLNNNPGMARVLLEAGARTDDGESVYHSTEHPDLECLRLLLGHGAAVNGTNALRHILDYENEEGLRLLLAAGGNPNEVNPRGETALHWAVWRGRSAKLAALLLDAGADIDARRIDGRTAYALAVRSGQMETARLLEARGASTEISEADRSLGALGDSTSFDGKAAGLPLPEEAGRLLVEFASSHSTAGVAALLKAGVPTDTIGEGGGTALHWACWKGSADLVEMLLAGGASITIEDTTYHATPPGWLMHGLNNSLERDGDYARAAGLLLAAGAKFDGSDIPTGDDTVDAVLREHGLI